MKDIYFFLTSHQIEKEKKKWMMGINLTSVDVVTSLVGGLDHLLNIHTKVISNILKRKIALVMRKNGAALHYVVIIINDGVQFYLMAKVLAVRMFN